MRFLLTSPMPGLPDSPALHLLFCLRHMAQAVPLVGMAESSGLRPHGTDTLPLLSWEPHKVRENSHSFLHSQGLVCSWLYTEGFRSVPEDRADNRPTGWGLCTPISHHQPPDLVFPRGSLT